MNSQDWLLVMGQIPALVTSIENTFPQQGSGAQKLSAVLGAVAPLIPATQAATLIPAVQGWIGAIVGLYNLVGFFKKSTSTPAQPAATETPSGG